MTTMKTATQVLEDQIANALAEEIAGEIDFNIICDLLVSTGWTKVELDSLVSNKRAVDMNEWLHNECSKYWHRRGRVFVFENKNEAALFKLTWL